MYAYIYIYGRYIFRYSIYIWGMGSGGLGTLSIPVAAIWLASFPNAVADAALDDSFGRTPFHTRKHGCAPCSRRWDVVDCAASGRAWQRILCHSWHRNAFWVYLPAIQ